MAEKKQTETPMMKQYFSFKADYPEAVLLFRCGDFYETYAEDAVRASKILNITLTHRSNGASKEWINLLKKKKKSKKNLKKIQKLFSKH